MLQRKCLEIYQKCFEYEIVEVGEEWGVSRKRSQGGDYCSFNEKVRHLALCVWKELSQQNLWVHIASIFCFIKVSSLCLNQMDMWKEKHYSAYLSIIPKINFQNPICNVENNFQSRAIF